MGLSFYLSQEADNRIEARLNDLSIQKNFITFKIPLHLPYLTDQDQFEPADGEINVRGEIYKLVKKKISRNTLYVICIDHKEKTRIAKNDSDYFNKINDLTSDNSKKAEVKPVKADYLLQDQSTSPTPLTVFHKSAYTNYLSDTLLRGHFPNIASPPEHPLS